MYRTMNHTHSAIMLYHTKGDNFKHINSDHTSLFINVESDGTLLDCSIIMYCFILEMNC